LPIFNHVGEEVWKAWDTYLENSESMLIFDMVSMKKELILSVFSAVDIADGKPALFDKSVPWPLKSNPDGLPVLPPSEGLGLPELKKVVRAFITLTYRQLYLSLSPPTQHI
jgi:hypothetical protein